MSDRKFITIDLTQVAKELMRAGINPNKGSFEGFSDILLDILQERYDLDGEVLKEIKKLEQD